MITRRKVATLTAVLLFAACGPGGGEAPEAREPDTMESMEGMPGMGMEMGGPGDDMARMGAHMQRMAGMSGDSIQGMLATHRQMAANMIARMNREMAAMDMPGDDAWNATVDSLREDLVRMPEMGPDELEGLMPGHHRRMMRLMEAHQAMMAGMGM